jgi:Tfp pilus assembly protein PilW
MNNYLYDIIRRSRTFVFAAIGKDESGFSLAEFLISSLILLIIAASVFGMMAETQRASSYQSETQSVLQNTRIAMSILERYIRQAANDPIRIPSDPSLAETGFAAETQGVTIVSATEIRLRTDITGSGGPSNPDKGDPDDDAADAGEDITIRYNPTSQSIEITPTGGAAQPVANHISAFSMTCYDAAGGVTTNGAEVHKIRVSLTAASAVPNPQTGQSFSQQLISDIQLSSRD